MRRLGDYLRIQVEKEKPERRYMHGLGDFLVCGYSLADKGSHLGYDWCIKINDRINAIWKGNVAHVSKSNTDPNGISIASSPGWKPISLPVGGSYWFYQTAGVPGSAGDILWEYVVGKFQCPICKCPYYSYTTPQALVEHIVSKHKDQWGICKGTTYIFCAPFYQYQRYSDCMAGQVSPFPCPYCSYSYLTEAELVSHLIANHKTDMENDSPTFTTAKSTYGTLNICSVPTGLTTISSTGQTIDMPQPRPCKTGYTLIASPDIVKQYIKVWTFIKPGAVPIIPTTQAECEAAGKFWYDDACHTEKKPGIDLAKIMPFAMIGGGLLVAFMLVAKGGKK